MNDIGKDAKILKDYRRGKKLTSIDLSVQLCWIGSLTT